MGNLNNKYDEFYTGISDHLRSCDALDDVLKSNNAFISTVIRNEKVNIRRYAAKYKFVNQHDECVTMIKNYLRKSKIDTYSDDVIHRCISNIGIVKEENFHVVMVITSSIMYFLFSIWLNGFIKSDDLESYIIGMCVFFVVIIVLTFWLLGMLSKTKFRLYWI